MYNDPDLERMPFMLVSDFYKGIFIFSILVVTCLFLWGLFSKKYDLVRKIIGVELLLFFLYVQFLFAEACFAELGFLVEAGIDTYFMTQYLRSYLFKAYILSAVSLYKLLLFLLLIVQGFVHNRRIKKRSAEDGGGSEESND